MPLFMVDIFRNDGKGQTISTNLGVIVTLVVSPPLHATWSWGVVILGPSLLRCTQTVCNNIKYKTITPLPLLC